CREPYIVVPAPRCTSNFVPSGMVRWIGSCVFSVVLLIPASLLAQKVKVSDFEKTDLRGLKTFRVVKGELTITREELSISEDAFYGWVKEYVRNELEPKGYVFTEEAEADFT